MLRIRSSGSRRPSLCSHCCLFLHVHGLQRRSRQPQPHAAVAATVSAVRTASCREPLRSMSSRSAPSAPLPSSSGAGSSVVSWLRGVLKALLPTAHPQSAADSPPSSSPRAAADTASVADMSASSSRVPSSSSRAASTSSPSSSSSFSPLSSMSVHSQDRTLRYAFLGNLTICGLKLAVWLLTSSQAMFAELIHTVVDSLNQSLLLVGARQAARAPDSRHQMGYGRAPYFFSLISGVNLFWFGVVFNTYHTFISHSPEHVSLHWYSWLVLGLSLLIDGAVLRVSLQELNRSRPVGRSLWKHWKQLKNPLVLGTIMEDAAAVSGVLIAAGGIGLSFMTGQLLYDHLASLSISGLLLLTSYTLVRTNYKYLLGFSLSPTLQHNITTLIKSRPSVQCVYSVRGEWTAADSFAFRAQLDFDGAYFSKLLEDAYAAVFESAVRDGEEGRGERLRRVMALFAEDVTRLVEEEVLLIESHIRSLYPQAAFIELECAGASSWRMALAEEQVRTRTGAAAAGSLPGIVYNARLANKQRKEEATAR